MINLKDLIHKTVNGEAQPSFTEIIAEDNQKVLTAEVFLKEGFPMILFCIYLNGEGEYAGNTLDAAVEEFNKL